MTKLTKLTVVILVCFLSCKKKLEKSKSYKSDIFLSKHLDSFTSKMTDMDTIKIYAQLNMEYWIRVDELIVTKNKDKIHLQTTIKEDTTFERKFEMRMNALPTIVFNNIDNDFEKHF